MKEAKKLIVGSQKKPQNVSLIPQTTDVKINANKRNRDVPDYVKLSPHEFMSWWIASTGAKRKASNILLHYMKFKFGAEIPTDYRTLLKTPVKPVPIPIHPGTYGTLELLDIGIEFDNGTLPLKILNFVLDAPARCYCKQVIGVNGYFGCDVCVEEGDYIDRKMASLNMKAPESNDVDYRTRVYDDRDYHKVESV